MPLRPLLALALSLSAFVAFAPPSRAEGADETVVEARRLARRLLAHDAARREVALDQLIALLDHAGEGRGVLVAEATRALATWADRPERLEEAWQRDLLTGDVETRERAARLLHALGPAAITRLGDEARRLLADRAAPGLSADAVKPAAESPMSESDETTEDDEPAGEGADVSHLDPEVLTAPSSTPDRREPRLVDATPLVKAGASALDVRTFLTRVANASQATDFGGGRWMVLAEASGHARLAEALARVATSGTFDLAAPADAGPSNTNSAPTDPAKDEPQQKPEEGEGLSGTAWDVTAHALVGPVTTLGESAGVGPRVATLAGAAALLEAERTRRDVREIRSWSQRIVAGGPTVEWFAGREIPYNRAVVATKDGAWAVATDTLRDGYTTRVSPKPRGDGGIDLEIEIAYLDVNEPLFEQVVRPSPDAEALSVHRPVWSSRRDRAEARIGPDGGAVAYAVTMNGESPSERFVLVARFTPQR